MSVGLVVFSRLSSRRLPRKALRPVCGRPLLGHVLDRVSHCNLVSDIAVATSDLAIDDEIVRFCEKEGVTAFRGAHDDVLRRALGCCKALGFEAMVRVTGDSPFIDPILIDQAVALFHAQHADLVTNAFPRSFPVGMTVEVVSCAALRRAEHEATDLADREHLTRYIYRNPHRFAIDNIASRIDQSNYHLSVDTERDLRRATWLFKKLERVGSPASTEVIVQLATQWHDCPSLVDAAMSSGPPFNG